MKYKHFVTDNHLEMLVSVAAEVNGGHGLVYLGHGNIDGFWKF